MRYGWWAHCLQQILSSSVVRLWTGMLRFLGSIPGHASYNEYFLRFILKWDKNWIKSHKNICSLINKKLILRPFFYWSTNEPIKYWTRFMKFLMNKNQKIISPYPFTKMVRVQNCEPNDIHYFLVFQNQFCLQCRQIL